MKHMITLVITLSLFTTNMVTAGDIDEVSANLIERYDKAVSKYQSSAIRALSNKLRNLKSEMLEIRRDRSISKSERDRRVQELSEIYDNDRALVDDVRAGNVQIPPMLDLSDIDLGDIGFLIIDEEYFYDNNLNDSYFVKSRSGRQYTFKKIHSAGWYFTPEGKRLKGYSLMDEEWKDKFHYGQDFAIHKECLLVLETLDYPRPRKPADYADSNIYECSYRMFEVVKELPSAVVGTELKRGGIVEVSRPRFLLREIDLRDLSKKAGRDLPGIDLLREK